ncbi:Ig-like domain-containing protein [Archangium minus]
MKHQLEAIGLLVAATWLGAGCNTHHAEEERVRTTPAALTQPTGAMFEPRQLHQAVTLADGRVLAVGGLTSSGQVSSYTEAYRPSTNDWVYTGYVSVPRYDFSATRLSNGKVLIAGGLGSVVLSGAELFDPASETWSTTGSMAIPRSKAAATLLSDGRVLVTGGQLATGGNANSAEIYNPSSGTWSTAAAMNYTRLKHTATRLTDGRVLVAGTFGNITTCEIYNPSTNTWSNAGNSNQPHGSGAAVLLPSGKVLVVGGDTTAGAASAELYDPAANTWTLTGSLAQGRKNHGLILLSNGDVLAMGGQNASGAWLSSVERWTAATGTWTAEQPLASARSYLTANLLADGSVLVVGGASSPGAERYTPGNGTCVPTTCVAQGKNCGSIPDGCGGTLQCGTCGSGQVCSTQNVCTTASQVVTAVYDSTRRVPVCSTVGTECTSGTLLNGRAQLGPEANAPNTLNASCADGTSGAYHSDESLDRLRVVSVDGTRLTAGKQVRIEATVWVWGASSDQLDLYAAANANSPSWTFLGTLTSTASGAQVLSQTYTLPQQAGLQVIRGLFRYGGSATGPCVSGSYNDHDDLVFAVDSSDSVAPVTSLTSPAAGTLLTGTVTLSASASDNVGVTRVEFYDGTTPLGSSTSSPYSFLWNTRTVANGAHTLSTKAYDAAGNVGSSASVTVTIDNDKTAPQVSLTEPTAGATLTGTVTLSASASDNVGVTRVDFYDGTTPLGSDTSEPYTLSWATRSAANGTHTLLAKAYDEGGNVGTSTSIQVNLSNDLTAPVISIASPASGATVRGIVPLSVNATDNVGVILVQYVIDGAVQSTQTESPFHGAWDTSRVENGTHTLQAIAHDAAGNTSTSATVSVTVDNDFVAPRVSLRMPAPGTTVTGTVVLSASATDNVRVTRVEFYDEGSLLGSDTTAPYTWSWNTTSLPNGSRTLSVKAHDAAGNESTSAAVIVTVSNGATSP